MTNVAITGASGFIGSHLLSKLVDGGLEIKVLDFNHGNYPKGVKVIEGDLFSGKGLGKLLNNTEIVIHLAGQVLPGSISMDRGNTQTTINLVEECYRFPIKRIIFSSTVAVYGDSLGKIFTELDRCFPNTEYGKSKLEAEKDIDGWSRKTGGLCTIFRFFSIYGSGNKKGVIYNICKDFIEKGEVTVFGDGTQRRDLVFVDDAADLLADSVANNLSGVFNVGNGQYYSILDLISILEEIGGRKCRINFMESESEKVNEIIYSVDKLKREFNWDPKVDIKEGMKRVYEYVLKNGK